MVQVTIPVQVDAVQQFTVGLKSIDLGDGSEQMSIPCGRYVQESWSLQTIAIPTSSYVTLQALLESIAGRVFQWKFRNTDLLQDWTCSNWSSARLGEGYWQVSANFTIANNQEVDECLVRVGDLESSYPIFPLGLYLQGAGRSFSAKVLGDRKSGGVDAYTSFGYNAVRDEWSYSAVIPEAKKLEIQEFLSARCGNYFEFRLAPTETGLPYTCPSWQFKFVQGDYWEFSATFKRNFLPFKETFVKKLSTLFDFYDNEEDIRAVIAATIADIDEKLDATYDWLMRYKRNTYPLILNDNYCLVNSFHTVLGRGGYFPPSAGTTEGQAIITRAAMLAYLATNKSKWLTLAQNLGNALLQYFYPLQIPANWTPANGIRVPHWLLNIKSPFISKGSIAPDPLNYGHFDLIVNFTNGVGFIPTGSPSFGDLVANVYRVYPSTDRLLWKNIYARPLGGFSYPIDYWVTNVMLEGIVSRQFPDSEGNGGRLPAPTSEPAGKIVLASSYTGPAKVVYSTYTGPTIGINQPFEAYPMWRSLRTNEALGALDVFPWIDEAVGFLYQGTSDPKWLNAQQCNRYSEVLAATIINPTSWYEKDDSPEPFAYPGSQVILANYGDDQIAVSTRVTNGDKTNWIRIDIPTSTKQFPSAELQNFAVQAVITNSTSIYVEVAHSQATEVEVILSLSKEAFDFSKYYTARIPVPGSGQIVSRTLAHQEFLLWNLEKTAWYPHIADNPVYSYSGLGGSVIEIARIQDTVDSFPRLVWKIRLNSGSSGFAGAGFVMLGKAPRFPLQIYYKHTGSAKLKITVDNKDYYRNLPTSSDYTAGRFDLTEFEDDDGKTPRAGVYIQKVEIQAIDGNCTTHVFWIAAAPQSLPVSCQTYKSAIVSRSTTAHTLWVGDFKALNSPSNELPFHPGAVCYTCNVIDDGTGNGQTITAWQGTVFMLGYQYPEYYVRIGDWFRLNNVLDAYLDSQKAYAQLAGRDTQGLFMPGYVWNMWSSGEYTTNGAVNVWTTQTIDPSFFWAPYAYRANKASAQAWRMMVEGEYPGPPPPNLGTLIAKAEKTTMEFLYWANSYYVRRRSVKPATNIPVYSDPFTGYEEPHASSLLGLAALEANIAGKGKNAAVTLRILKAALNHMDSQYLNSGLMAGSFTKGQPTFSDSSGNVYREQFGFWAGEQITLLAEINLKKGKLYYPKCVFFVKPDA